MLAEDLGVGRGHPGGHQILYGVVILLGFGILPRVGDGIGIPVGHPLSHVVVAELLVAGPGPIRELAREEVGGTVFPLGHIVSCSRQYVCPVDGLYRILHLHAHGQDHVGKLGADALHGSVECESTRPAGAFRPGAGFVLQGGIDIRDEAGQVALSIKPGRHEISDDALVDVVDVVDLIYHSFSGFLDVFLQTRAGLLGMEFSSARTEGNRIVSGTSIYRFSQLFHLQPP